ncbi:MAG TPA: metalloregulator ArsR/SmtB family transcription factor [Aggregatilineales bacterium]|nr:winged helix-turn-helix transcriptional regulator [Anaerolineae bacterium]HUN06808.1 metalloregulator ArsR/SmtB family transcription factor [Aggregatilineales bacterium]
MSIPGTDELQLLHEQICQAVGDVKRIQILYALHEQPRHVSALAELLEMPQPTVSRHLTVLRERALVIADRQGPAVVYRLADPRLIDVLNLMRQLLRDTLERRATALP